MVSNFDAKAQAVGQWIKDTMDHLGQVAEEADSTTANGLQQKIDACERYSSQVDRYETIMQDLKEIVDEVQPPYVDAERIADTYNDLVEQLQEMADYVDGYSKDATESLTQVEAVQKLVGLFVCLP